MRRALPPGPPAWRGSWAPLPALVALLAALAAPAALAQSAFEGGSRDGLQLTVLTSWKPQPAVLLTLLYAMSLYGIGWWRAWRRAPGVQGGLDRGRLAAFAGGALATGLALLSPLETLAGLSFAAHMAQHLLLVLAAAPLLVAGATPLAFLWALPLPWRKAVGRALARGVPRRAMEAVSAPLPAWLLFVVTIWAWHHPTLYQAAVRFEPLHALEHGTMLASAALFWWSIFKPYGRRGVGRTGAALLLFAASLQGGLLGALIALAPAPWYGHYLTAAPLMGIDPLFDQQLAGLLMWVPPGLLYLCLAAWAMMRGLDDIETTSAAARPPRQPVRLPP